MSENTQVKESKTLVKFERRFLGARVLTANKGKNAGQKLGLVHLYELRTYDDGSVSYDVPSQFVDLDVVKEILSSGLAPWTQVKVIFKENDSFFAKPKIKSLVPIM